MKTLYIIRGVPGSGKSTLAHKLTDNVVEADQFMYVNGEYKWAAPKLHYAHAMCKRTVEDYMIEGREIIAVANTFIKRKEVQPYIDLANEYGYKVIQKVCEGNYQNVHNVPQETVEKMRRRFEESVNTQINEGIEDVQKYFPKMSLENIKKIVALDPTYKGGEELGKYGKWIIRLVYNNIKNMESQKQFAELMKRFPDGINPKNGQKFQEPQLLPAIKDEDLYKVKDSLKQYDLLKKKIGKPIDAFKTLPELDMALNQIKSEGVPTDKIALKRYNLIKSAVKKGFKIIYEDNDWIIGIPETKESSKMFGSETRWCTTSDGQYYERYTKDGPLFINLNKNDGKLYQFHFETESFMNEDDYHVNMEDFEERYPNIINFYKHYLENAKANDTPETRAKKIIENKTALENYFEEVTELKVDGDYVYGKYDVLEIPNNKKSGDYAYVYDYGYHRDAMSLNTIASVLSGDSNIEYYDEFGVEDLEYAVSNFGFDEKMKPYGITWDDIADLLKGYKLDNISETIQKEINDLLEDYDINPLQIFELAQTSGTANAEYTFVVDGLKDNLPLDEKQPHIETDLCIKFPIKDILESLKMRDDAKNDDYDESLWYKKYSLNDSSYYDDSVNHWLYKWREIHFRNPEFGLYYPRYGLDGFDDDIWNEGMNEFIKALQDILKDNPNISEHDDEINEVLKIAGIK